jgi:NADH-quinone oxidoreductase subunit E
VAHLSEETLARARAVIGLYPHPRSALVPVCHLAQAEQGWLTPEAVEDVASLVGLSAAEVAGTASFYDMLHLEPVGRFVVSVCTNIACLLAGADRVLEHAARRLGVAVGGTTEDGMFTVEEAECLADCDHAPCVQVNHRYVGPLDEAGMDRLLEDLRAGRLDASVPPHGVLSRVARRRGLEVDDATLMAQRQAARAAADAREREREAADPGAHERARGSTRPADAGGDSPAQGSPAEGPRKGAP